MTELSTGLILLVM